MDPAEATVQAPQPNAALNNTQQSRREGNSTEGTVVLVEPESQPERDVTSDMEVAEASDDSSVDIRLRRNLENLSNLHLNDESPPPSDSESSAQQTSNATVAPVDIISRKPVPGASNATSSRLEQPGAHMQRTSTRTPSPNGLSSSVGDALAGVEGPMTPRNDAGPFIFDGSAGRGSEVRLAALPTMNLNEATEIPPATPQPAV